ncbi:MAG: folate-binding protein YgfZ [Alphaproteobacteria bacterium]|nr:folate-binding protein YgfZ [Alphaproteobacteria bacterium]
MIAQTPFFSTLKNRGLLRISGPDARKFLQGLITNDIDKLDNRPCIYACLLTPQGKFLYDFFITEENNILTLDCEGGPRLQALEKLLGMYRLRANVEIKSEDNTPVYAILQDSNTPILQSSAPDPRHPDMGARSFEKPQNIIESPFEAWDRHRINLTIPDGSRDLIPQNSTMEEANMDEQNAIDYNKGCYLGQELTARMHYRGLGKKHLKTVTPEYFQLENLPAAGTILEQNGQTIGEMRSSCQNIGLALLKDAAINPHEN